MIAASSIPNPHLLAQPSFPGSAWEGTAPEALPPGTNPNTDGIYRLFPICRVNNSSHGSSVPAAGCYFFENLVAVSGKKEKMRRL
jgi:hypothetical protein